MTGEAKTKLLRVTGTTPTATICAGCLWRKTKTGWKADRRACASILLWMVGKRPGFVLTALLARGWDYEWLDVKPLDLEPRNEDLLPELWLARRRITTAYRAKSL